MARKRKFAENNLTSVLLEKGELCETTSEKQFEWKIKKFSCLSEVVPNSYCSPSFTFNFESWYLQMIDANKFYNIILCRECNDSPTTVEISVALKTVSGEKDLQGFSPAFFEMERSPRRPFRCLSKSELERRKVELIPSGVLTVVCCLRIPKSTRSASKNINRKCFCCKENLGVEFISFHETCIDRPIRCADCFEVLPLQSCFFGHECLNERTKEDESLSENFRKMLFDGRNHDLVLKIGEKEFRAHKDVLMARSQVFRSMLTHDMAEKNSGVIDMPDCDPEAMGAFLSYVYSGKVETLNQTNMFGLYYIADKYEMMNLKNKSCSFIKMHISPTNFCEVIQLALNHSDSSLQEVATEYFIKNMLDILRTVEWQCFLKNNSVVANELLIKSCDRKK